MSKGDMTLVYYYVPEDKDDPQCPNVFGVPQSKANIRLSHIHGLFPLKGSYIYRFKHNYQGNPVWLDLPDIDSKIPTYKDRIIVKATRVSWSESKLHSQYRQKQSIQIQAPTKSEYSRAPYQNSINNFNPNVEAKNYNQKNNNNHFNILDEKLVSSQMPKQQNFTNINLLDGMKQMQSVQNNIENNKKKQEINLMHDLKHGDLI